MIEHRPNSTGPEIPVPDLRMTRAIGGRPGATIARIAIAGAAGGTIVELSFKLRMAQIIWSVDTTRSGIRGHDKRNGYRHSMGR